MAFIQVTGIDGKTCLINGNSVTKVIDYDDYRVLYQGSDTNNFSVSDTLEAIADALQGS